MTRSYPPEVVHREAASDGLNVLIVCEHASNAIPPEFGDLGLDPMARQSHIAWDPGAVEVAREMRRLLGADLVAGSVSRLLYDCNRPPEAPSAMPAESEVYWIAGNANLTVKDRALRTEQIYQPFRAALELILDSREAGLLLTIHSFTPVYHGVRRTCEIGILHDADIRLAEALLAAAPARFPYLLERNVPYSATDGVTHTLRRHAIPRGWPNVMIEIRNDLIETPAQQLAMAGHLVSLLKAATNE